MERASKFFKKYFCAGQKLRESGDETDVEEIDIKIANFIDNHRQALGLCIPPILAHFIWWSLAVRYDFFSLFPDKYLMTLTMIFGGFVAGGTATGGGAVAFPVMTMALKISAPIARDYSFLIQTTGMSCASFGIWFMRLRVENRALLLGLPGGFIGLLFGLHVLDPLIAPALRKMIFVSFFFSFAIALFILNRQKKRPVVDRIVNFNAWKAFALFITAMFGGAMTALTGSGLDIMVFSVLTLLFSVSEKVATPTSVIVMATNSAVAVFWRHCIMEGIDWVTWEYLAVTGQIVVIMAPVLAALIYFLETASLIGAFIIIRPSLILTLVSVGIIVGASIFFLGISWIGFKIVPDSMRKKKKNINNNNNNNNVDEKGDQGEIDEGTVTESTKNKKNNFHYPSTIPNNSLLLVDDEQNNSSKAFLLNSSDRVADHSSSSASSSNGNPV